ncbi:hypothetical protein BJV74DRAFT_792218, partial [Russula compacta]
ILSLTCNNASNNDVLVDNLADKVALFGGDATHVCCFTHVVTAKGLTATIDTLSQ